MAELDKILNPKLVTELDKVNKGLIATGTNMSIVLDQSKKLDTVIGNLNKSTGDQATKQKKVSDAQKETEKVNKLIVIFLYIV